MRQAVQIENAGPAAGLPLLHALRTARCASFVRVFAFQREAESIVQSA